MHCFMYKIREYEFSFYLVIHQVLADICNLTEGFLDLVEIWIIFIDFLFFSK